MALIITSNENNLSLNQMKELRDYLSEDMELIEYNDLNDYDDKDMVSLICEHNTILIHFSYDIPVSLENTLKECTVNDIKIIYIDCYKPFDVPDKYKIKNPDIISELEFYKMEYFQVKKVKANCKLFGYDLTLEESVELYNVMNDCFCSALMNVTPNSLRTSLDWIEDHLNECNNSSRIEELRKFYTKK